MPLSKVKKSGDKRGIHNWKENKASHKQNLDVDVQ